MSLFGFEVTPEQRETVAERDRLFSIEPPACGVGDKVLVTKHQRHRELVVLTQATPLSVAYEEKSYMADGSMVTRWIDRHLVVEVIERAKKAE